ncbi:hypothetical protein WN944_013516 [Citrus x changshan-huyou]|uniref:Increased DNA methylation 1 C-terminal domain-containing protein n=1 Tax=Citrus x changshan-huyou TaxID=2935761 RepID=A0AAP0M5B9_9ROSI
MASDSWRSIDLYLILFIHLFATHAAVRYVQQIMTFGCVPQAPHLVSMVHGTKIAKIPLVGTRERFRSGDYKGTMMPKLLAQIESALRKLNVQNLVIPAVPELVPMWINKYGFTHIENNLMTELINYNTLMFPTAVRLPKSLVTQAPRRRYICCSLNAHCVTKFIRSSHSSSGESKI